MPRIISDVDLSEGIGRAITDYLDEIGTDLEWVFIYQRKDDSKSGVIATKPVEEMAEVFRGLADRIDRQEGEGGDFPARRSS